ncbi:MAG: putative pre6S rRNA nuclease [Tenuifilum sp.]|uniref:Putative pre-16S rRNA nuclease n=1 Tax=Tenuifilum thalassicum TaxID=2590900 RepID=A0A7D3XCE7_9BACT|nr:MULTISPECIES: Holliday junction resolvase RuvX [Tenuifilum]MDI3526038.1 putative pre6S rRNA nuclease [Tenuifilum sp.]QKG79052.1 Holliday junction resolvase RuvX [Tenuifilum thalassicum]
MGRIVALDIGRKRTGVALTDPLKIIASPLDTIPTHTVVPFLEKLLKENEIELIVVGYPLQMNNTPSEAVNYIKPVVKQIKKKFPNLPLEYADERFTSKLAMQAMIDGGMKKKDRQVKANVDKISASIILQSYLEGLNYK